MTTDTETIPLVLLGRVHLRAKLKVLTGLHIGAGKDNIEIGGIDNPVVKTPQGDPYVPGSSIKGKMRFLLEWAFGKIEAGGRPWSMEAKGPFDPEDPVLRIFGTPAKRDAWSAGPTRLMIRDAMIDPEWRTQTLERDLPLTESKTEVLIDRIAGKAHDRVGPRQTERVPQGAVFDFEAAFRIYGYNGDEGARDLDCLAWTVQGLGLIEQDALGGSGSRGYGRVTFEGLELKIGERPVALDNLKHQPFSADRPSAPLREAIEAAWTGA